MEVGESSRTAEMRALAASTTMDASRPGDTPRPKIPMSRSDVDITRTKTWGTIDPTLVDPGTAVTHVKLNELASMNQALAAVVLEQTVTLKKLSSDVSAIKQALGGSSPATSRRSSIGSASRRSSLDDTIEDAAVGDGIDILGFLDEFFEGFVQRTSHKPLKKRTKNVLASARVMITQARQNLSDTVGDDSAAIINDQLATYDDGDLQDLYVTLSKRYYAHKAEGKKVATVNENFETDVENPGDGSQSTNVNTPRPRRSNRIPQPTTPAPPRFGKAVDDDGDEGSLFVDDNVDETANDDEGGRRVSFGDASYAPGP